MAELKDKLRTDLTSAMKSQDKLRTATLRMLLAAIQAEEVSGKQARELTDAEVIAVADEGYRRLGLSGFRLEITSLGDDESRPRYREALQEFLFGLDLDEATRMRADMQATQLSQLGR